MLKDIIYIYFNRIRIKVGGKCNITVTWRGPGLQQNFPCCQSYFHFLTISNTHTDTCTNMYKHIYI